MKRIEQKFNENKKLLSIYFTAGFPALNDTFSIIETLENCGVDMIEIGLPFSDPLADGAVIQSSSTSALQNGMNAKLLFEQLANVRQCVQIPLLIMGYWNPILQFGVEKFLSECKNVGIDALIIPDLPPEIYVSQYQALFTQYQIDIVLLITPQTSEARIRYIDSVSTAFIYVVASASVTGNSSAFGTEQQAYFNRIKAMELINPLIAGFGIYDQETFDFATRNTRGAIIGSAFIKNLSNHGTKGIKPFLQSFAH